MGSFPRPFQSHFVMVMIIMVVPMAAVDNHHTFGMSTVPSTLTAHIASVFIVDAAHFATFTSTFNSHTAAVAFTVSTHFTTHWSTAFFTLAFIALYLAARCSVLLDGNVSLRLILSD
jgi:hypothetical protein